MTPTSVHVSDTLMNWDENTGIKAPAETNLAPLKKLNYSVKHHFEAAQPPPRSHMFDGKTPQKSATCRPHYIFDGSPLQEKLGVRRRQ